jgi:hypothetical protein
MGLFGDFKQSLSESAGRILWDQLQDTQRKLANLPDQVRADALMKFVSGRAALLPQLDNMSTDGKIKIGIELQKRARATFDLNMAAGYGYWLTGAWIESMVRPGLQAAQTFDYLDGLAEELQSD